MAEPNTTTAVRSHPAPLTDEQLAIYKDLVMSIQKSELKDALETCLRCVEAWWQLPVSNRSDVIRWQTTGARGEKVVYNETPLEHEHVKQLDAVTPWMRDCMTIQGLFDELPSMTPREKMIRNMAFHLIWHVKEISLDREPLTRDVVGIQPNH